MKPHKTARCTLGLFVASLLSMVILQGLTSPVLQAQTSKEPGGTTQEAAQAAERELWRKSMARHPLPRNGCFHASYPEKEWKEVACGTAPPIPFLPQGGGGKPAFIGGGGANDFSAQVAGLISTAEGSFNSITGLNNTTSTSFSLQLNSNTFNTVACNGGSAGCVGWEQYVFANTGCTPTPACGFIQVWLIGFGPVCPAGGNWLQTPLAPNDCFKNTAAASAGNSQPIANLVNLTVTGTAVANGQDTVVVGIPGGLNAAGQDNVLSLAQSWNTAEYNVFGFGNGTNLAFNNGTTIVVKTSANDGSGNAPTCLQRSFTGETNNLNLADVTGTATLVCCPYGGVFPAIEFMETNATPPHTAICGPTALIGDPHITTIDGGHYDFQAAGEFISLRDFDGSEIQTRQRAVSTTFIGTDGHDGLTTCVSLNSAVAARVGEHRVTYEPNLSGVPDPTGLQLRIDGALTGPGPTGVDLGNGGRIVRSFSSGDLEIDFPDGKTLFVTPGWWASQNQWYLNVDITHNGLVSGAVGMFPRGIAGPIPEGSWLPTLPNGSSLGSMPGPTQQRYDALYHKFADAWRVTDKDSLFDYAPGTSTQTFTMRNWPLQQPPCVVPETKPVEPASEAVAEAACRRVTDPNRHANCVFDVRATGNPGFATTYLASQRILADSTTISLTDDAEPSQVGEPVTFTAFVLANSTAAIGYPSGTVQFTVDGSNVGAPVLVDAKGRARWETLLLRVGRHRVQASYVPGPDSVFLPSTSLEKVHIVRRCPCESEHERK